jgi:GT2 family glycosyltransferase
VDVTIAINTWNRSKLLDATLCQMRRLDIPSEVRIHFLIVDNNSNDNTKEVIQAHASHLPIEYAFEPRQGTSYAKNAVLERATGELLLWTDDDVLVDQLWLKWYIEVAAQHPEATIFGGTVRPWFEHHPPGWLIKNMKIVGPPLALVDRGPEIRALERKELITGANMAFRTSAVARYRFDTKLGDIGGEVRKGEETDLIGRMRQEGHRALWVGPAIVRHHVPASRMTRKYVRDWYEALGATYARTEPQPPGTRLFGVPRWIWRKSAQLWAKRVIQTCLFRSGAFKTYLDQAMLVGMRRALKTDPAHRRTGEDGQ